MPRPKFDSSLTASRKQLLAVAVLIVALIGLLAFPTGKPNPTGLSGHVSDQAKPNVSTIAENHSTSHSQIAVQEEGPGRPLASPPEKVSLAGRDSQWTLPLIDIEELIAFNPFQDKKLVVDDSAGETGGVQSGKRLTKSVTQKVDSVGDSGPTESTRDDVAKCNAEQLVASIGKIAAIITGTRRPAVMIEDQVFYEQDVLKQRWRILAIKPTGIVVQDLSVASQTAEIN